MAIQQEITYSFLNNNSVIVDQLDLPEFNTFEELRAYLLFYDLKYLCIADEYELIDGSTFFLYSAYKKGHYTDKVKFPNNVSVHIDSSEGIAILKGRMKDTLDIFLLFEI